MSRRQRIAIVVLAMVSMVVLSACHKQPAGAPSPSATPTATSSPSAGAFITFDQFLSGIKAAKFADYARLPGAQVKDEQAFEEMRAHILRMYDGVKQVSSFVLDGQYADCITIDSQPSVRQRGLTIETAPTGGTAAEKGGGVAPGDGAKDSSSVLTLGLTDAFGNPISCADGTIPMQRITLERLVTFKTLQDFFAKSPDGLGSVPPGEKDVPDNNSANHRYAHAAQSVTNFGGNSWLNLWNPTASFSLSQQWYVGGSGSSTQTVEGGWIVYPNKFGSRAVLFIFWTADNYGTLKCWNLECVAFVQTNNHWYLGGPWSNYSTAGGTQWGFEMQWKLYHGNWWLFLKGPGSYEAVGYYPTSQYRGGQLSRSATRIDYGGETFNVGGGAFPPMGSGQFASTGWQQAAFQNTIFYIPRDENDGVGVWASLGRIERSPSCYTINLTPSTSGGSWGTYIFFGGPGGSLCPVT
jgi:neprosin-like protein